MEDTKNLKESLSNLKALGASMSIDDFGTGYTSLSYLRNFSFDLVKIDGGFIQDIAAGLNGKAIADLRAWDSAFFIHLFAQVILSSFPVLQSPVDRRKRIR